MSSFISNRKRTTAKAKPKRKPKLTLPNDIQTYRFIRNCSSNANAENALPISIKTDSITGRPAFTTGIASGTSMALVFKMAGVDIYLNGSLNSFCPMPGSGEFPGLFDEYRIDKVDVMVLPTYGFGDITTGSAAAQLPWIVHSVDTTDYATATSDALMQHQDAKWTQLMMNGPTPRYLRSIKPCVPMTVTGSGTANEIKPSPWLNTDNINTQHFGLKLALDDSYNGYATNVTVAALNLIFRYHLSFRGTK